MMEISLPCESIGDIYPLGLKDNVSGRHDHNSVWCFCYYYACIFVKDFFEVELGFVEQVFKISFYPYILIWLK